MSIQKPLALIAGAIFLTLVLVPAAHAEGAAAPAKADSAKVHEYVGSKTCKMCHNAPDKGVMYGTWEKTGHAQAFAKLPAASQKDAKCLPCHTTGYGKPGGYDPAKANAADLAAVGCESCHGPGKDYKGMAVMKDKAKAKEAGLITPDAASCKGCHEGAVPTGHKERPKFDFATMKVKIAHSIPKK